MTKDNSDQFDEACGVLCAGAFTLNMADRTVAGPAGVARLSPMLTDLLALLMSHSGEPVTRRTIMEEVWQTSYLEDTRTLDVHVRWLRQRIEPQPSLPTYLVTRRGVGYVFYPEGWRGGATAQ